MRSPWKMLVKSTALVTALDTALRSSAAPSASLDKLRTGVVASALEQGRKVLAGK